MSLIVQKFGGTSVGDIERIEQVADKVAGFRANGDDVVVVVSATVSSTRLSSSLEQATRTAVSATRATTADVERRKDLITTAQRRRGVGHPQATGPAPGRDLVSLDGFAGWASRRHRHV